MGSIKIYNIGLLYIPSYIFICCHFSSRPLGDHRLINVCTAYVYILYLVHWIPAPLPVMLHQGSHGNGWWFSCLLCRKATSNIHMSLGDCGMGLLYSSTVQPHHCLHTMRKKESKSLCESNHYFKTDTNL